jgi:hypothetical protein
MNLIATTMPDDPAEQVAWLERQLVGIRLRDLVLQLSTLGPAAPTLTPTLEEIFGDALPAVLAEGLSAATPEALGQLLRHPSLLLDLQERLLLSEGSYWQRLADEDAELHAIRWRATSRLNNTLRPPPPTAPPRRKWVVALVSMAATVLVALGLVYWLRSPPTVRELAWGWSRPGAIPAKGSAGEYYDALARAANQWYDQRPDDAVSLARRLGEYRDGCSHLLLDSHTPLREIEDEEAWLVGRCRRWAERLDRLRDELETGTKSVTEVRAAADELTRRIELNFTSRADHVRSLEG